MSADESGYYIENYLFHFSIIHHVLETQKNRFNETFNLSQKTKQKTKKKTKKKTMPFK